MAAGTASGPISPPNHRQIEPETGGNSPYSCFHSPPMSRPVRPVALLLALLVAGCAQQTPPPISVNEEAIREAMIPIVPLAQRPPPPPPPAPAALERQQPVPAVATGAAYVDPALLILDARSPDRMVASLQAAEQVMSPRDVEAMRSAMVMVTDKAKASYVRHVAQTRQAVPRDKLFELAYGHLHGKSIAEVIRDGVEHAEDYIARSAP